jgi:arsenate reductase
MSKITIYQKPTCTTCRQVDQILKEKGVKYESVNYYTDPISKTKLKELIEKLALPSQALLRAKEDIYKKLNLKGRDLSQAELVDLLAKHPDLLQRPIVEKGQKVILARPAEKIKELF